jgi:sterol desaturase/sphingolipid hydroxylase (fatty acid hydroxylase superfamily)
MLFIYEGTKNKENINSEITIDNAYKFKDYLYLVSTTFLQSTAEIIIYSKKTNMSIYFLFKLFLFELILDFFHYTFHRLSHKYYYFHKTHHYYKNPRLLNTFITIL